MKIKKNLSDADMLRSFSEKLSFENEFSPEESTPKKEKNIKPYTNSFMPEEIEEKFSELMLEVRTQLLKENRKNIQWRVKKDGMQIIIYPKDRG